MSITKKLSAGLSVTFLSLVSTSVYADNKDYLAGINEGVGMDLGTWVTTTINSH